MTHQPWSDFAHFDNLEFRAVCNEGAAPADRPLDQHTIMRLARRAEGAHLYDRLVELAVDSNPVLKVLSSDPCWRTLVAEVVHDVKSEQEQLKGAGNLLVQFWNWFSKKPSDGSPSPRQKAATTIFTSLTATAGAATALAISVTLLPANTLVVPVSLQRPADERLALSVNVSPHLPDDQPLKLALEPSISAGKIPIEISTKSEPIPLQFSQADFQALDRMSVAVAKAAAAMESANRELAPRIARDLSQQVDAVRQAIANLQLNGAGSPIDMQPVNETLAKIANTCTTQPAGLEDLSTQLKKASRAIAHLSGVTAASQTLATMAAAENQETQSRIDWVNADGTIDACDVKVTLGKVTSTVDVTQVRVKCGNEAEHNIALGTVARRARTGDVLRSEGVPFGIAVGSIQRPLFGPNIATLRLLAVPIGISAAAPAPKNAGQ